MLESTQIPTEWTFILNHYFDAVIVPDPWLVNVYKNSGVMLPIFVLPIGLHLSSFFKIPTKTTVNKIFTFGLSAAAVPGKNHEIVIDAFVEEFLKNPCDKDKVRLRIHSRGGKHIEEIRKYISDVRSNTIEFIPHSLPQQKYIQFMASLDCYVLLSMGEGFSITPREALALGIPCILSNAAAHKTICESSFVEIVDAPLPVPAYYSVFNETIGLKFNCKLTDVRKAMRNVYNNYLKHLARAQQGREWVKNYDENALKEKYLSLVKPRKVVLGNNNRILDSALETDSVQLYEKYVDLLARARNEKTL
jgi:glycosyltransferase involved in cell wall biosynthesis